MATVKQVPNRPDYKWSMVVDIDRCTGCQACVVACQSENNVPINDETSFQQHRAIEWIRIERYWEGEFPNVKARFIPVLCQHCENAPCEPVCPVYATYHNNSGMNVQVYNRCVGTRYCANGCPYHARNFNYKDPEWPDELKNQLNPDVTVRHRGIMEKCSFCVQRIRRATRAQSERVPDGAFQPACAQACPTDAIVFGDISNPQSKVAKLADDKRHYKVLKALGTDPNVIYLKKVEA
jgi:Fe-S-cluster-containing dehydrogenase component